MSTFCRITGHTRGLPKQNHFFPILPPISPAEAKKHRTNNCRITTNFNPNHNYIPIKTYLDSTHVSKCPITRNSLYKYKHFQFIAPVTSSKSNKKYFYLLDSKVLLIPDEIEMQMSKGIITDVQISNHTIGFKYNYKVKEYDLDVLSEVSEDNIIFGKRMGDEILPGAGIKVVKKRKIGKRRGSIAMLTSVFEEKEKSAEIAVLKSQEKITPDREKIKVVQGKLEEVKRKNSLLVVPPSKDDEDSTATITLNDQVKYLLKDGSVALVINNENKSLIKGTVCNGVIEYGKILNNEFVPGQVVKMGTEEKFVPGRFIEHHFTPGQVVEVQPGTRKFVPGQVMDIHGENKFVPGQLVIEDDTGAFKFVPGRVLDGEFHAGEMVETQEGLKFICDNVVENEFELQAFELENDFVPYCVDDVKAVVESIVPKELDLAIECVYEQAVFEKRVDERVVGVVKEKVKGVLEDGGAGLDDLVEAIEFARVLGNEAVARELEMVLHADEHTKASVLGDSSVRLLLCQLVVLKGLVGGDKGASSMGDIDGSLLYKSNVVAKVLMDEGFKETNKSSRGAGSSGGSSDGGVGDEKLQELSQATTAGGHMDKSEEDSAMHHTTTQHRSTVIKESYSVETHGDTVIEFSSMHRVEEGVATVIGKRQRLTGSEEPSLDLDSVPQVELLDTTPAKHKLSLARQLRKRSGERTGQERRAKIVLKSGDELMADSSLVLKNERDLILYELIETEEEFVRDLEFVMGSYYKEIEASPKFGNYRDLLFDDFKAIYMFHKNSLVDAIRYYQDDPVMIAKSFLRLERDFEPHVRYYQDHLKIDEVISNDLDLLEFIEDLSVSNQISDTKSLSDHLKLPLQRINDYVLIFKDLLDVCSKIHDDPVERDVLSRVLEFLVAIPQKLDDRKFLNSIEGIDSGVLGKLGRLLGHDWFVVTEEGPEQPSHNRYVFLFKQKILVTKVKRISDNRSVFLLKQALHLPDYKIEQLNPNSFKLTGKDKSIIFDCTTEGVVDNWTVEISKWANKGEQSSRKREAAEVEEELLNPKKRTPSGGAIKGVGVLLPIPSQVALESCTSSASISVGSEGTLVGKEPVPEEIEEELLERRRSSVQEYIARRPSLKEAFGDLSEGVKLLRGESSESTVKVVSQVSVEKSVTERAEKVQSEKTVTEVKSVEKVDKSEEKVAKSDEKVVIGAEKSLEKVDKKTEKSEKVASQSEKSVEKRASVTEKTAEKVAGEPEKPKDKLANAADKPTEKASKESETPAEKGSGAEKPVEKATKDSEKTSEKANQQVKVEEKKSAEKAETKVGESRKKSTDKQPQEPEKPDKSSQDKLVKETDKSSQAAQDSTRKSVKESETKTAELKRNNSTTEDQKKVKVEAKEKTTGSTPSRKISVVQRPEELTKVADQDSTGLPPRPPPRKNSTTMSAHEETPPPTAAQLGRRRSSVIMARQTSESNLKIIEPMQSTECEPGDNAEFKLKVSSGQTIITWLKGNRPLGDKLADRVRIESKGNTHSLKLLNCREEDGGLYTAKVCEIVGDGGIGEPVSCSAVLVIHELTADERAKKIAERDSPQFLVKFKDTELLRHTTVSFMFLIKGNPEPEVVFKRNDTKLQNSDRLAITSHGQGKYELKIDKIEDTDAGTYTVIASNKHGITEVNAVVKVVDEKDVFQEGTAMRAEAAEGGERKGLLEAGEEPIFMWFKDGKTFEPGEDFKVLFKDDEDTLALVFQHVKPEDAGLYTCVASTTTGRISCSAELTVQGGINQLLKEPSAPVITAQLTDTEVSVGGSAMLELKVTGFPKPDIAWYKGGNQLEAGGRVRFLYEDDESSALIIKNVNYDDEGLYKVVATNDLGEASTQGNLIVRQPPKFLKKMEDMSMMAGETFTIDVEVEGNPKPELKWYKDGVLIVSSERIKFCQSKDGQKFSMLIERVTLDDTGAYSVVASNAVGQMSEFWNVLATMPAKFTERLPGQLIKDKGDKGGEFILKTAGVPDPKVEVKLDGKDLKVEKLEHQVYKVVVGELTELKDYQLVATATNTFAKDESVCVMNVNRGVKIVEPLKDILVKEHGECTVGVKVDCFPKPKSVKWFIDGVEIGGNAYVQKEEPPNTYTLTLKDCYKKDGCKMGVKVMVDNGLGQGESAATITVQAPPVITSGLAPLYRLENATTQELNVTLKETTPTPTGTWYHNGKEVSADARIKISKKSTETYTLTFDVVKYEDAGEWAFKAVNDIGEVWSRTTVIVEGKPQFTSPLPESMRILETETYDLEVKILDYCEENVKIEWKSDVETVFKPVVARERSGDEYVSKVTFVPNRKERYFKCVATNKYGESESICQIDWVELVPPKIMSPLKDTYTIQDGDPFHFESEVEGVPKPRVVWMKNGEVIGEGVNAIDGVVNNGSVGEYTLHAVNVAGEALSTAKLTILQTQPTASNLSDNYKFKESEEDLVLSVDISGSPIPTVTWLHNNEPIDLKDPRVSVTTTPTKSTLVVKNAAKSDKGAYSVQVSNGNGQAAQRALVDITFPPEIKGTIQHPDLVTKCTRFELKAQVLGEPFPEISWIHPTGKVISCSEPGVHEFKVYPDGTVVLAIESAQMTDGGIYKLVAKNERGQVEVKSGVINVEAPRTRPRINPPLPAQVKLVEGQPLTLRTTVKAHPIPELALKFDDSPMQYEQKTIENGLEFEHKTAAVKTSGTYTLKATNSEGSTESECQLMVIPKLRDGAQSPPKFIQEPLDKQINEGTELVLLAKVDGNPIPDIAVIKDGVSLDLSEALEFDGNTMRFRIASVGMGDAGEYSVKLTNSEGEAEKKVNVKVNKIFKAPEFMMKFTDQAQLPTRDCKFGAKIKGFPTPEVRWLKDGKELDMSRVDKYKAKLEDDCVSLQVKNCDDNDIGVYTCELSNVEGKATCNAKLDVTDDLPPAAPRTEAPYFLKTIGSTEVYPGMQAKFTACIGGNPEPEFEWFKDGKRIYDAPASRVQLIRDGIGAGLIKLIINDSNIGDLGDYKLRIWNDLGEDSCVASLTFDSLGKREQSPLGDYYKGYSDLRPTALPDRPVITRMDDKSLTLNWKAALPNVHSKYPCTYLLEMAPADTNDWKTVYSGLKNCYADVDFPTASLDYKFRVRVQWGDKFVSEPSPYVITNRNKLNLAPLQWSPIVVPSIPRSYDLTRPPHPEYTHAPRFLNPDREIQYASRNHPASVHWAVYGYPKPTIQFKFNGEPVTGLNHTYTDNGLITLFLNEMNDTKIGTYECIATNQHGIARSAIELQLTEHPRFIEHLRETNVCARRNGKLHCIVTGLPCPTIKLFKDWQLCGKQFNIVNLDNNTVSVTILFEDCLLRDEGLYSIVATNHAGSVHSSAMLRVHEDEQHWNWVNYGIRPKVFRLRKSDPNDWYHFGSIIGRGTQAVHFHVVETRSGNAWAAKKMNLTEGPMHGLHRSMIETEIENWANVNSPYVVRLYDGFFDRGSFTLVNELCNGGDLFNYLVYELEDFDERVLRQYLHQVLQGVHDLHEQKLWVCGLQPLDILLTHKRSSNIKITDLGISRYTEPSPQRYSHPEFASPELISGSHIGPKTDLWSIGVIAHILLTGHHPYVGLNDRETMENLKNWNGQLNETWTSKLSKSGRSFLESLLRINPMDRLSACQALDHEWFQVELPSNNLFNEGHVKYYNHLRAWQSNADCIDYFRRNPLETAYKHPSKMVYPPGYDWVEEREFKVVTKSDWEMLPRPEIEIDEFTSESHYTSGDDTYLLQLRDTDFPARLRQYMKVAARQSATFALHLQGSYYDRNVPIIRERRKFTDIMDEEVDDERRQRIVEYGEGPLNSEPRRLRHEVGTRLDIQAEAEAIMAMKREGREPCFRERPSSCVYVRELGGDFVVKVVADGEPGCPDVQWFKNDTLLQSNDPVHHHRLEVEQSGTNTMVNSSLTIHNTKQTDLTHYKVTARNKQGQVTWKFRIALLPSEMLMPKTPTPPDYAVEKNPTGLTTSKDKFDDVSTPEVVLKGAFTNVLKSGGRLYKVCSNREYEMVKKLANVHLLGGDYTEAIQVGNGVAMMYENAAGLKPLLEHIVSMGSYTEQNVVNLMEQVLNGLAYLHWANVGVIGLGPGTITVDEKGIVKLINLSSAQKISRVGVNSELGDINAGKTNLNLDLEFCAPEALSTSESTVSGQSDIWSVGVLIYLLLSGHSPFKGADEEETKQNILFVRFRFEHLYKDLSQEATRLIMLIFKRSPLKRPSAEECFEHRWFQPAESLCRKRSRNAFNVERIKNYLNQLNQDEISSSTSDHSNNLLSDFYRVHNL